MVQVGSVLVRSKCLTEQICFTPKPWIRPGSEQMHRLNRVFVAQQCGKYQKLMCWFSLVQIRLDIACESLKMKINVTKFADDMVLFPKVHSCLHCIVVLLNV